MTRKLGSALLALSVLWAVISLLLKSGVGVSLADSIQDFNITGAKIEITHETANECFTGPISCNQPNFDFFTSACSSFNSTRFFNEFPKVPISDSDSYELLANLALNPGGDFEKDLNQTIFIALANGACSDLQENSTFSNSTWIGVIPGSALHMHSNPKFTMYTFEGPIPRIAGEVFFTPPVFDQIEFNLKIPTTGNTATLALEGNANLCPIQGGPMALFVALGTPVQNETLSDMASDTDFACFDISAPEIEPPLDISPTFCPLFGFGPC